MKNTIIHLSLALLAGSLTAAREPQAPRGQRPPPPPIIAALDANRDGIISAEEIANAPNALLKLDQNNDGQLTQDELHHPQGPPPPRGGRPPGPPRGERPGPAMEAE